MVFKRCSPAQSGDIAVRVGRKRPDPQTSGIFWRSAVLRRSLVHCLPRVNRRALGSNPTCGAKRTSTANPPRFLVDAQGMDSRGNGQYSRGEHLSAGVRTARCVAQGRRARAFQDQPLTLSGDPLHVWLTADPQLEPACLRRSEDKKRAVEDENLRRGIGSQMLPSCIHPIVLIARFQQRVLPGIAYGHFGHVRLEQVVKLGGTGPLLEGYPQARRAVTWMNSRTVAAFVSTMHSISAFPAASLTAIEMLFDATSMPIYFLLFIGGAPFRRS